MSDVAAGWYPDPANGLQERWWNGQAWAADVRPIEQPTPAPVYTPPPAPAFTAPPQPMYAPAPTPSQKSGCLGVGLWVMFAILAAFVLLVGGCVVVLGMAADDAADRVDEIEALVEGVDGSKPEPGEKGAADNPYAFGVSHSRKPGLLGAGWTISIDEVRPIPKSPVANDADPRVCAAIIVTVTLDSLDNDELTASSHSVPELAVVDANGKKAEIDLFECDGSDLIAEGITGKFELSLTEGGTGRFYEAVLMDSLDFEYAAVESTIYVGP